MESSLVSKSQKLIEQLSKRKEIRLQDLSIKNNENSSSPDNLLFNSNNIRQKNCENILNKHKITDSLPKSSVNSILSRSAFLSKSMPKRLPFGLSETFDQSTKEALNFKTSKNSDLLGYDWIVGMMENKSKESQLDKPSEYFEELDKFRRQNKQFCISTDNRETHSLNVALNHKDYNKMFDNVNYECKETLQKNSQFVTPNPAHVYAYTLNERLFPVPLDLETAARGPADLNNPHIIKVSIPSNRFLQKNKNSQTNKDKNTILNRNYESKNLGESLSLSSHCQSRNTIPISHNDSYDHKFNSFRQQSAGLIGNVIQENNEFSKLHENIIPFGHNQPKTEQEAIDQLKRGKTGAKLSRLIPSSLENRNFNIDLVQAPSNICQTRIVLKELMDDSNPRESKSFVSENLTFEQKKDNCKFSGDVPRSSISRKEMAKVYVDAIENVRDKVICK